jgi:hypothetical protein
MLCDFCDTDIGVSQYWQYDLFVCPTCEKRFEYREKLERKGLIQLEKQQRYFETLVLPYPYSHPST